MIRVVMMTLVGWDDRGEEMNQDWVEKVENFVSLFILLYVDNTWHLTLIKNAESKY